MSQEQYNALLSNLLREKRALAKLREELEERKGKLCRSYKGFGHLARNCRNRKEREGGAEMPQNKFEILRSRVMQCGMEERVVRGARRVSQKVTYLFCDELDIVSKELRSGVRQATKDVVKSEV